MDWYQTYWNSLKSVIAATWAEVPLGQLWQDNAIEKFDWINLINNSQLTPPWVVVKLDTAYADGWGAGIPKIAITSTIYYVASTEAISDGPPSTAAGFITEKLIALMAAALNSQTLGTVLQEGVTIDTSAENPINVSFIDAKVLYQAGSIQFVTITNVAVTSV